MEKRASPTITYQAAATTTFTPPAKCMSSHVTQVTKPNVWGACMWEPLLGDTSSTFPACYPKEFMAGFKVTKFNPTSATAQSAQMSPLICPKGWYTALTVGSAYGVCCPSQYTATPGDGTVNPTRPLDGGACMSEVPVPGTLFISFYEANKFAGFKPWIVNETGYNVFAQPIDGIPLTAIQQQERASQATSLSDSSRSISFSISTQSSSSSPQLHHSISGGAIAGIVIGALAGLALVIIGAILLLRRRRHRTRNDREFDDYRNRSELEPSSGESELSSSAEKKKVFHELNGNQTSELYGTSFPHELSCSEMMKK